jgi:hypothetical protein
MPCLVQAEAGPPEVRQLLRIVATPDGSRPENTLIRWTRIADQEFQPQDPQLLRIWAEIKKLASLAVNRFREYGLRAAVQDLEEHLASQIQRAIGIDSSARLGDAVEIRHFPSWRGIAEQDLLLLRNRSGLSWRDALVGVTLWDRNGSRWFHVHRVEEWRAMETVRFRYPYRLENSEDAKGAPDEPARVEVSVFLAHGHFQQILVWGEPEWEEYLKTGPLRNARITYHFDHGQGKLCLSIAGISRLPDANLTVRMSPANRQITWQGMTGIRSEKILTLAAPELGTIRPGEIAQAEFILSFDRSSARVPIPASEAYSNH